MTPRQRSNGLQLFLQGVHDVETRLPDDDLCPDPIAGLPDGVRQSVAATGKHEVGRVEAQARAKVVQAVADERDEVVLATCDLLLCYVLIKDVTFTQVRCALFTPVLATTNS